MIMATPRTAIPFTLDIDPDELVKDLVTEDDTPVDNIFSKKQMRLLTEPLYHAWPGPGLDADNRPRLFLVAANVGMFPSIHQPPLVPDVFLSLDVRLPKELRKKRYRSYFFWEYGKAPEVVIEVVSNREGNELGSKLQDYARIGVLYYAVYDPEQILGKKTFHFYENRGRKFVPRTNHYMPDVGLGLTIWEGSFEDFEASWLRWCDAQGELIPTGAERAQREAERAQREAERAQREAERAERLAQMLRELGIDPNRQEHKKKRAARRAKQSRR